MENISSLRIVFVITALALLAGGAVALSNDGGGSRQYSKDITISNPGGGRAMIRCF